MNSISSIGDKSLIPWIIYRNNTVLLSMNYRYLFIGNFRAEILEYRRLSLGFERMYSWYHNFKIFYLKGRSTLGHRFDKNCDLFDQKVTFWQIGFKTLVTFANVDRPISRPQFILYLDYCLLYYKARIRYRCIFFPWAQK